MASVVLWPVLRLLCRTSLLAKKATFPAETLLPRASALANRLAAIAMPSWHSSSRSSEPTWAIELARELRIRGAISWTNNSPACGLINVEFSFRSECGNAKSPSTGIRQRGFEMTGNRTAQSGGRLPVKVKMD
jgi:hypothetical protein